MSINFIPSGVGSLIAGFLFSSAISPASAAARLDEVVISASRIELPREQVGSSVTVFDARDIDRRAPSLVADLLRSVASAAVNRSGPIGSVTQVRLRGAEGNHTLVMLDGIEVNDPAYGSEFDFATLLPLDIERLEVLRGSQSALWGSDAIGGVINVVTRRGPTAERAGLVELQSGSFNTQTGRVSWQGGSERLAAGFGAQYFATDGISAAPSGAERDGYRNFTTRGSVAWRATDALTIDTALLRIDGTADGDQQDFRFPSTATQGLVIDSLNRAERIQTYGRVGLRYAPAGSRVEQRANIGITRSRSQFYDSVGIYSNSNEGRRDKYDYQATLRFGDAASVSHALTGAMEYERTGFASSNADPLSLANQDRSIDQTSGVLEYRGTYQDRLFVSAAVRHDDNARFQSATTWRGTAAFVLPSTNTRLHASVGTGIANPGLFELFGFIPSTFIGNPDLTPEQSTSWDIGIERRFMDDRWIADLTYFHADLTDEIQTVFLPPDFNATVVNATRDSKRKGVELDLRAALGVQWDLRASYTYTDAEEPKGDANYARELRRPRQLASLNVNYAFAAERGNLNIGFDHNGRHEDSEFITATPATTASLDAYTLVNAAAQWRFTAQVAGLLRLENALGTRYQDTFGFAQPGFGAYAAVRISF
ncbi:MAG: TonB-dependent receptor [Proteobacteria bacterium]|nr:TonB-dependent receptor [Pseudomonadota bacterium]